MRSAREAAELAAFLVCLCLGFTFSFVWVLPTLRDVPVEFMKHICAVGMGFGLGVCFFLIYLPIQDVVLTGWEKLASWIDSRDEARAEKETKKKGGQADGS